MVWYPTATVSQTHRVGTGAGAGGEGAVDGSIRFINTS